MKQQYLLLLIVATLAIASVHATAQTTQTDTYTVNIEEIVNAYGLGGNDMIVNAGDTEMTLSDPILV